MTTPDGSTPVDDLEDDTRAVIEHAMTGKLLAPEVYRRIRERGERLTEEIRRQHGEHDIAVNLLRETLDEE
jgi:hypothetical protein